MLKQFLITAITGASLIAMSAFAVDMSQMQKSVELKDGSVVYIFKNGKMGMEDKNGRPARMKPGVIMETKDGQKIMMVGDEVMRVEALKNQDDKP